MVLTWVMIRVAPRLGLIDHPEARRIHVKPVPRAGGIAVFLTMLIGFAVLFFLDVDLGRELGTEWLLVFFAAASLLVAVGVADDRWQLSAWVKLGGQVAAAAIMYQFCPHSGRLFGFAVPWVVAFGVHMAWYVLLINAFNLIDGMDGLCAGLGLIALTILGVLAAFGPMPQSVLVLGVMAMALLGFLRYNFHPARIFLGDAGSMLIGFFIASVGAATVGRSAVMAGLLLPLLVAGVPLFDVFLAIWRRMARRMANSRPGQAAIRVFDPDRDHLHHRMLSWGLTQRQVALAIYALAAGGALLALMPMLGGSNLLGLSLVAGVVIALVGLKYLAPVELIESGAGLRAVIRRPRGARGMVTSYFLYDTVALTVSALVAVLLIRKTTLVALDNQAFLLQVSIFTACGMLGLCFGKAHVRRWMRAGIHDFAETFIWLLCGAGISFSLQSIAVTDFSYRFVIFHLCAVALAVPLVFLPRCLGAMLREFVIDTMHRRKRLATKMSSRTALLYGAGDMAEVFLCFLRLSPPARWADFHFVGFLDDSESLKGRRLGGFPILGGLEHLRALSTRMGINCVVVTANFESSQARELLREAERLDLEVLLWLPEMEPQPLRAPNVASASDAAAQRPAAGLQVFVPSAERTEEFSARGLSTT
jgi:UDP-N-acetylmuramyl pentapeptide phosphotransferase/UDP-N-acetylglucosamine-1-phosphate transferase